MDRSGVLHHIEKVAQCPSFSSYEERLHPYIKEVFENIPGCSQLKTEGNNLVFQIENDSNRQTVAIASHLDKINHYGSSFPASLPVSITDSYIKGAMDNSAGVGLALTLAEKAPNYDWPNLLFFFSEMEESKGLKENPELLKNHGEGYHHGMGARRIANSCKAKHNIPNTIITLDTTPLFEGKPGIALYSKHWELNELNASEALKKATSDLVARFQAIHPDIRIHNNTNDYLHYGYEFNADTSQEVVSLALEPAIYPYHQKGEKVFIKDIYTVLDIMTAYLNPRRS